MDQTVCAFFVVPGPESCLDNFSTKPTSLDEPTLMPLAFDESIIGRPPSKPPPAESRPRGIFYARRPRYKGAHLISVVSFSTTASEMLPSSSKKKDNPNESDDSGGNYSLTSKPHIV
jgi:hypothetical protein